MREPVCKSHEVGCPQASRDAGVVHRLALHLLDRRGVSGPWANARRPHRPPGRLPDLRGRRRTARRETAQDSPHRVVTVATAGSRRLRRPPALAVRPGGAAPVAGAGGSPSGRRLRAEPCECGAVARVPEPSRNPSPPVGDGGRPRPFALTGVLDDAVPRWAARRPRGDRRRRCAARSSPADRRRLRSPPAARRRPRRRRRRDAGGGTPPRKPCAAMRDVPAPLARRRRCTDRVLRLCSTLAGSGWLESWSARGIRPDGAAARDPAGRRPRRPRTVPRSRRRLLAGARGGRRGRRPGQVPRGRRPDAGPPARMPSARRVCWRRRPRGRAARPRSGRRSVDHGRDHRGISSGLRELVRAEVQRTDPTRHPATSPAPAAGSP